MKASGWIFMACAWLLIIILTVFCFKKIFEKGIDAGDNKGDNK